MKAATPKRELRCGLIRNPELLNTENGHPNDIEQDRHLEHNQSDI